MKRAPALLLVALLTGCALLKSAPDVGFVAPALREMREATVAVLPFDNTSGFLGADYLVTDEFNLRLGMTGYFRLVERIRVKELYREQDFDPRRVGDTEAVRIGRMLGARLVLLGTVTRYLSANRPPEIPLDAFPVLMPVSLSGVGKNREVDKAKETDEAGKTDEEREAERTAAAVVAVANTVAGLAAFFSMKPPVAEVGVTVRLVSTETGEILWQARNGYRGDDEDVARRQPREVRDRMRQDVVFLTTILATDLVSTLTQGMTPPEDSAAP